MVEDQYNYYMYSMRKYTIGAFEQMKDLYDERIF